MPRKVLSNFQEANTCEIDRKEPRSYSQEELIAMFLRDQEEREAEGTWQVPLKPPGAFRVMSWNVHMGAAPLFRRETHGEIVQLIVEAQADVVALQEFPSSLSKSHSRPSSLRISKNGVWTAGGDVREQADKFNEEALSILLTQAGFPHGLVHLSSKKSILSSLGNAVFSKVPLERANSHELPTKEPTDDIRNVVQILLRPEEGKPALHIACTHLDVWDESGHTRQMQVEHLIQVMKKGEREAQGSQLLLGDFNSSCWESLPPLKQAQITAQDDSRSIKRDFHTIDWIARASLHGESPIMDVFIQGRKQSLSFLDGAGDEVPLKPPCATVWSGTTVDFAFIHHSMMEEKGGGWKVSGAHVIATAISDHLPLIIDLITE